MTSKPMSCRRIEADLVATATLKRRPTPRSAWATTCVDAHPAATR